jgi:hypothetical protein
MAGVWPVHDDAGELVAEHQRLVQPSVADARLGVPVQVRAAQADRGDPHEAHPVADDRIRSAVQPQIPGAVQARDPHQRTLSAHQPPRGPL